MHDDASPLTPRKVVGIDLLPPTVWPWKMTKWSIVMPKRLRDALSVIFADLEPYGSLCRGSTSNPHITSIGLVYGLMQSAIGVPRLIHRRSCSSVS